MLSREEILGFFTYDIGIISYASMSKLYVKNKEVNFARNICKIIEETGAISESDVAGNVNKLYDQNKQRW